MLLPTRAAGRHTRRLAAAPALVFTLAFTGLAASAQNYGQQQPYPDPSAQQGYGNAQQGYGNAQQGAGDAQQDPPSRVARLSVAQGNVSVQPASVQDFAPRR